MCVCVCVCVCVCACVCVRVCTVYIYFCVVEYSEDFIGTWSHHLATLFIKPHPISTIVTQPIGWTSSDEVVCSNNTGAA